MHYAENKKARFNYDILTKYEAGIELLGFEVKSVRGAHCKLDGAHVIVRGGEAYVIGMSIPPYQAANMPADHDPMRSRRLLLTKKELVELAASEGQKGLTIVPISVYNKSRKVKVEIAVVRGRKKYDKRNVLKERDTKREMSRTLKNL